MHYKRICWLIERRICLPQLSLVLRNHPDIVFISTGMNFIHSRHWQSYPGTCGLNGLFLGNELIQLYSGLFPLPMWLEIFYTVEKVVNYTYTLEWWMVLIKINTCDQINEWPPNLFINSFKYVLWSIRQRQPKVRRLQKRSNQEHIFLCGLQWKSYELQVSCACNKYKLNTLFDLPHKKLEFIIFVPNFLNRDQKLLDVGPKLTQ